MSNAEILHASPFEFLPNSGETGAEQVKLTEKLNAFHNTIAHRIQQLLDAGLKPEEIRASLSADLQKVFDRVMQERESLAKRYQEWISESPSLTETISKASEKLKQVAHTVLEKIKMIGAEAWHLLVRVAKIPLEMLKALPKPVLIFAVGLLLVCGSAAAVLTLLQLGEQIAATASYQALASMLGGINFSEFFASIPTLTKLFGSSVTGALIL
ncbi:MAG: hypothetical protein V2A63_01465 [Patescibacteria group bacterium]